MKRILPILILTISLLLPSTFNSQWITQTTVGSGPIYDIFFININTGWAVGQFNTILRTTNGGINWNMQNPSGGSYSIYSVSFVDQYTGWAVSSTAIPTANSILYKTTNGGVNWSTTSMPNLQLVTVCFKNNLTGWIGGGYNTTPGILKTTDGGLTWVSQQNSVYVRKIFFLDINTGWLAGPTSFKTTNGGLNWISIPSGTTNNLRSVYFINSNTGWGATGLNNVDKTTNGGVNWFTQVTQSNIYFMSVCFADINSGWAVGGGYPDGIVLKTTDGGMNWNQQICTSSGHDGYKDIIFCFNNNIAWIGGGENFYGVIYGTTNGGVTGTNPASNNIPAKFVLSQNYPNPFNPETKIGFDISETGKTKIVVYDVYGKEVSVLLDEDLNPGSYEVTFNGEALASSVYFYSIITKDFNETKKMILLK